ncbi:LuxR C-terminal-related transcriptional regulator [Sodalis sp. RH16]|uniref:LuxR C-terminal-related transcriptional regulator n=1 Tax=Sodalis sp. RH16 TaxID=3394331 RepID=UPI0039B6A251
MRFENGYSNAITLIEKLDEPWGIKDAESRHVYMNPPARKYTNTPDNFPIEGKLDIEFPAEWHELHDELIKHDQITMNKKGSVSVLEVHHWNGCSKPTPFISDKIPIYESDGNCIGIIWNAKPASIVNPTLNIFKKNNCKTIPYATGEITEREHEVIWLIIHGYTRKEISYILNISSCAVKCRLYSVFQKKSIFNIKQLRELYINNRMDSYIPSSILKNGLLFL